MTAPETPSAPATVFATAIAAQMPSLRSYAAGLAGSAAEAEDLVQDALLRIWRYRGAFRPDDSLRAWMFSILRNVYRSHRRRREPWVEDADGSLSGRAASPPSQEWRLQYGELLRALGQLDGPNRQAILMVAIGLSYAEAADACGCDVPVLKSRVHRARARLAKMIGASEAFDLASRSGASASPRDDVQEER